MKNKFIISVIFCVVVFNIFLLYKDFKLKETIRNSIALIDSLSNEQIIHNKLLRSEILYLYNSKTNDANSKNRVYNSQKQLINWRNDIEEKILIIIPESKCTQCFMHGYFELLKELDLCVVNKIILVKNVKEIQKAIVDDVEGNKYYIENGLELGIEKYDAPYLIYVDKYCEIKYTFLFDMKHPSTFLNAINFIMMKQNENI
ncbi:MAG: hypothetical protein WC384_06285 [Prolixibacteraceae bacterium]|jgi:hypothetical protein